MSFVLSWRLRRGKGKSVRGGMHARGGCDGGRSAATAGWLWRASAVLTARWRGAGPGTLGGGAVRRRWRPAWPASCAGEPPPLPLSRPLPPSPLAPPPLSNNSAEQRAGGAPGLHRPVQKPPVCGLWLLHLLFLPARVPLAPGGHAWLGGRLQGGRASACVRPRRCIHSGVEQQALGMLHPLSTGLPGP